MKNGKDKRIIKSFFAQFKNEFSELSYRSMFGGFGICQKNIMFCLVYNDKFYLRSCAELETIFSHLNFNQLVLLRNNREKLLNYYEIPHEFWLNTEQFLNFVRISYKNAEKTKKTQSDFLRLKNNPNISLSLERMLNNISIMNIEQLKLQGSIFVFSQLKKKYTNLNINVLFMLEAAILGCHVAVLSEYRKKDLIFQFKLIVGSEFVQ